MITFYSNNLAMQKRMESQRVQNSNILIQLYITTTVQHITCTSQIWLCRHVVMCLDDIWLRKILIYERNLSCWITCTRTKIYVLKMFWFNNFTYLRGGLRSRNSYLSPLQLWVRFYFMARCTHYVMKFVSDLRQVGGFSGFSSVFHQ